MRITIEIDHQSELDKLKTLFETLKIRTVSIVPEDGEVNTTSINQGDKRINPSPLFGIWANQPRSLEQIRKDAWERTQSLK